MYKRFTINLILLCLAGTVLGLVATAHQSLPIPRYISLKSNNVNLHVGPGTNYPTEWKIIRKHLPVEVIAEFDTWLRIRDSQGTEGWVHKSLVCGKRYAIILSQICNLYHKPDESSSVVARLGPEVIAKLLTCQKEWCRLDVEGYTGWIKRQFLWGVYAHETHF